MFDDGNDPIFSTAAEKSKGLGMDKYAKHLITKKFSAQPVDLDKLMNGPIRKKLKIIPENVT